MTRIRLLLNSPFTGANAFLALAEARGLFSAAGLELVFSAGRGAYTAASRLQAEGFDAAYGDLNALIEDTALHPAREPALAVCIVHQQAPSVLSVARAGPIRGPADLPGRRLVGHASDVALQTFGAYAAACGIAPDAAGVRAVDAPMAELLRLLLDGQADGVFGYTTTHTAALASLGLRADERLDFLRWRSHCPWLYGSALMAAPQLMREKPQAVRALVRCVLAGIDAARAAPEEAVAAAVARNPQLVAAVEAQRWHGTLHEDIAAAPGGVPGRAGDADDRRLAEAIGHLAAAKGWSGRPRPDQVFTRRFLDPAT